MGIIIEPNYKTTTAHVHVLLFKGHARLPCLFCPYPALLHLALSCLFYLALAPLYLILPCLALPYPTYLALGHAYQQPINIGWNLPFSY
jgi:hypothetical protein